MATVAVDRHLSSMTWPAPPQGNSRTRFQPGPPTYIPEQIPPDAHIPPHNDVELTQDMLITILEYFSQLVAQLFAGRTIRMVVHGGACMLLHPGLQSLSQQQHQMMPSIPRRTTTRDVDYIHRSFVTELASCGMPDAAVKIQECIRTTARHFRLGADWMNSDADIALPMAHDPSGKVYDPIYTASIRQNNIDLHTIFRSTNGSLTLISVTPFWAVSLKLVRYTKWDPGDICLLLRNGMVLSGTEWTPEIVESWLFRNCWAMGYHNWDSLKKANLRTRILNAIELLSKWTSGVQPPEKSSISAHDAMGGGDVMGGGEFGGNNGWSYSFGAWPNQAQQPQQQPQQQAPVSSIPFPVPTPVPPPPVNVRDWASPANDHPKRKSRSPSPYSRSRHTSTGQPQEIFIPPDIDWINHGPVSFRPRSRNPTPDPADDRWNNVYPPESNSFHSTGSRVPRADPYSSESLDRSISSMLHQSHHRNANLAVPPNNTHQPVIPIALTRKQKAKQRERERERERQSKWLPRTTGRMMDNSDTSDSSDDDDEPTSPSRVWQIYAQPQQQIHHMTSSMQLHGRSSQLQPGPSGPGLLDPSQLPTQCLPHHNLTSPLPTQRLPHHNLTSPLPTQRLPHHNLTSPLPTQRPPHHNLTSPLPTAPPPQMPVPTTTVTHMPIGLHSPPQFFGPSQLAQYQFEQQQQVYQQEQQQRYQQQQQQQQQQQHQQHQLQLQSWSNAGVAVFR